MRIPSDFLHANNAVSLNPQKLDEILFVENICRLILQFFDAYDAEGFFI